VVGGCWRREGAGGVRMTGGHGDVRFAGARVVRDGDVVRVALVPSMAP
jgi:hypothetical protein